MKKLMLTTIAAPLLTMAAATPCVATAPAARPNIIFIYADDHATQAVGAYGSRINRTPNIDRLARQGVVFDNSLVTNGICAPCRAVVLTGQHSHRNGVLTNAEIFDGEQMTFPKLLRDAGYQTALIGKWHLKSDPTGFDHWEVLLGQGPYYNPRLDTPGGLVKHEGYTTEIITDRAMDWLREGRDADRPFLLMMQHKAPHRNWQPGPDQLTLYDDVEIPEPPTLFDDYAGRASGAKTQEMTIAGHMFPSDLKLETPRGLTETQLARWRAAYDPKNAAYEAAGLTGRALVEWRYQRYIKDYLRTIAAIDDSVGTVLDWLDAAGLAEETVVIYSSDQGFYLGEHGWYDKRWMYEESLRSPLLVRWPASVPAGVRRAELVQNLDFAPTMLDLAGVTPPPVMQGRSLVPLLTGAGTPPALWRESVYYHYYEFPGVHAVPRHYGVRTDRHKLIHYYQLGEWELFDLVADPQEMHSVSGDPAYTDVRARLERELTRLQEQYGDTHPTAPVAKILEQTMRPHPDLPGYELVWHDEFNGRRLDATKWNHSRLGPRRNAVNVPEAVRLDRKGHLEITTSRHQRADGTTEHRTAMLDTQGLFATTYGYFEARIRLQTQVGHWSAFWLQTPTMGDPLGDPARAGAEIDIMEYLANDHHRGHVQHTLHWDGYGDDHRSAHSRVRVPGIESGFHTFGLEWTDDAYVFYVDGVETWRTSEAISARDQYLLLSLEVGPWAGDIADATLPDSILVDYVRVYRKSSP
ncbi:MAG: sulfatase-like hydrolase/transferase [Phycisphaerae bacterium]|nr:sulfatase-like hydrolase/transferase [Phycisphaerae bacterium]